MLNPFKPLEHDYEIINAVRAGVFPAVWIAISYILTTLVLVLAHRVPQRQMVIMAVLCVIAVAASSFLGWRVWKAHAVWASAILLVWACVEVAVPLIQGRVGAMSIALGAIAIVCAILSIRGSLKLRAIERATPKANPAVFD